MGTAVSIDVREPFVPAAALDDAFAVLVDIDRRFSLFLDDSELGRLGLGLIDEGDLSADVRWVLAACDDLARTSGGAFDARRHRPDGRVDPSGLVKGWAVESAAELLVAAGAANLFMSGGGDIVVRGEASPGAAWRIGIQHPLDRAAIAVILGLTGGAIATSGLYERGEHIRDPRTGDTPADLLSFTVVGPDLAWVDAFATAGFVMGMAGLSWVEAHPGFAALAITTAKSVIWSASMERHLVEAGSGPLATGSLGAPVAGAIG